MKNRRPAAKVSHAKAKPKTKPWKSPRGILAGKGKISGDFVNFHMDWNILRKGKDRE